MGLLKEQSGDLKILGEYLSENPVDIKNKIGFVYSELYMYENGILKQSRKSSVNIINNGSRNISRLY